MNPTHHLILMSWSPLLDWVTVHKFSSVVQVDFHVLLCKRSKYASVVLHRLGWVTKIPSWSRATIATLQHTVVLGWVKKQNVGGAVQTSTGACQCAELLWDFFLCHQYLHSCTQLSSISLTLMPPISPVVPDILNFHATTSPVVPNGSPLCPLLHDHLPGSSPVLHCSQGLAFPQDLF